MTQNQQNNDTSLPLQERSEFSIRFQNTFGVSLRNSVLITAIFAVILIMVIVANN